MSWIIILTIIVFLLLSVIIIMEKNKLNKLYELINQNDKLRQEQFQSFSMYIEDFWEYNYGLHTKERELLYKLYDNNPRNKKDIIALRFQREKEINDEYMEAYNKEVWKRSYTIEGQQLNSFISSVIPYIKQYINLENDITFDVWLVNKYLAIDVYAYSNKFGKCIFSCDLSEHFKEMNIPVNRDAVALRIYMDIGEILKSMNNSIKNKNIRYKTYPSRDETEVMSWNDFSEHDRNRFLMDFNNIPIPNRPFKRNHRYWD